MSNTNNYAAVEVSKDGLLVLCSLDGKLKQKEFRNTRTGHRAIWRYLGAGKNTARVVMEATGVYYLDLAIFLCGQDGIEVAVLNPRISRHFAIATLKRAKNDNVDVKALLDYVMTRPFAPFNPPSESACQLRAIGGKVRSIIQSCSKTKSQLHAEKSTRETPKSVIRASEKLIRHYEKTIKTLTSDALRIVADDSKLKRELEILDSVPGVAVNGALQILGELSVLPESLSTRQLVAFAGLDPVEYKSGSSVDKKKGISKRGYKNLRVTLYMAALSAVRVDPNVKAFYEKIKARSKAPIVAIIAVCRKLLHSIWGMLKHDQFWAGEKFYVLETKIQ